MRKFICMGATLLLVVLVAACGGSKGASPTDASSGGGGSSKQYPEFRLGELDWPGGVSFKTVGWIPPGQLESLVVQGLLEVGPTGQPKLGLASSIEHPSATTYVYNIRPGVKFSDGHPLTVADVVYSLDLNKGKLFVAKEPWEDVASVSARGSTAVVVRLKRPSPDWPAIMAAFSGVIEKAAAEKLSETELGTQHGLVIGSGPWKFDSYVPEVSVQLSSNPYWTGPRQPAAKINVTIFKDESTMALALRSGAIDAASNYDTPKNFTGIPGTHQLAGAQNWIDWMSLNTSVPPFNDVHVRRAIAYATDIKGIIKALFPAGGASEDPSIIPTPLFAGLGSSSQVSEMIGTLSKYEFSLAKAKQELARSAYPHGFSFEAVATAAEPVLLNVAQIVSSDLAKIGITVKVKPLQNDEATIPNEIKDKRVFINEYLSYVPNEPDIMMSNLLSPANIYPHGTQVNWPQYGNAELGKLLPEVVSTLNPQTRLRLAGKALGIAATEEPYVPLFMHSTFMTVSNEFVSPELSFYTTVFAPWALNMKLAG